MNLEYVLIPADDVKASLSFYEKALGLKRLFFLDTPDGGYGELVGSDSIKLAVYPFAEARKLSSRLAEAGVGTIQIRFISKSAEEVQNTFRAALGAGATSVTEPELLECGSLFARFHDPSGNLVSIQTRLTPRGHASLILSTFGKTGAAALSRAAQEMTPTDNIAKSGAGSESHLDLATPEGFLNSMDDDRLAKIFSTTGISGIEAGLMAGPQ